MLWNLKPITGYIYASSHPCCFHQNHFNSILTLTTQSSSDSETSSPDHLLEKLGSENFHLKLYLLTAVIAQSV